MSDTLNINGENYTVYIFRGKVLKNRTYTTSRTEITGSGGKQNVTEVSGVRLQALAGHDVIKIWIIRDERGPTVGFYNVTLNKFFWVDSRWEEFHRHTLWIPLLQMGSAFIALGAAVYFGLLIGSWLVFWALLIGVFIGIFVFTGKLEEANQQRVLGWQRQIAVLLDKYCFQKKAA